MKIFFYHCIIYGVKELIVFYEVFFKENYAFKKGIIFTDL